MQLGRSKKIYDTEIIMDIINKYLEEMDNPFFKIKYRSIYEYTCNLYKQGKLDTSITEELSMDFWRKKGRQGRILIDEINSSNN